MLEVEVFKRRPSVYLPELVKEAKTNYDAATDKTKFEDLLTFVR